jgi:hypothetical protein
VIGVDLARADPETVREFFELFKTPWEHAVPGQRYRAVLTDGGTCRQYDADVVIVYSSAVPEEDQHLVSRRIEGPTEIQWCGSKLPIYGHLTVFAIGTSSTVRAAWAGQSVHYERQRDRQRIRRVGYDLFEEVARLLTIGQPAERALLPTLELHIALLRSILLDARVSFVEVPPRPYGHDFICCLTHDLDFFGICRHKFDLTLLGFIWRSTVGSLIDLFRGRRSLGEALTNWMTCLSLPFVFAGLVRDPWHPFDDYRAREAPERSTFFVVPFRGQPGVGPDGAIKTRRAVRYQVSDIGDEVNRALRRGSEIALHGIDAWRDATSGSREAKALGTITGQTVSGVRMHWLYFDRESPAQLERAGFTYDSTWGYNEAIGYRAGTSQVFKLSGTRQLLELPLSIMDSALLFPDRMNLSTDQASALCRTIVENAVGLGGTLVVNWHDRSLAPERLWNRCYQSVLSDIKSSGRAWYATASQAVDWYRWRRSIQFTRRGHSLAVSMSASRRDPSLPAAVLRTYGSPTNRDLPFTEECLDEGFAGTSTVSAGSLPAGTRVS